VIKPVLTNAYLCKDEVLKNINAAMDDILAKDFDWNEFEELVLDMISEKDFKCGYYFINHKSRTPVWLERNDISDHLEEVMGATSADHISMTLYSFSLWSNDGILQSGHEMEAQYW
jgi:hypothetical protein